jgi:1-acyl-sn-glycerol-3-phosphate acyltransferase
MAKDMDLPILPVTILGTEKILPKKTLNLVRGKSEIIFHPVIEIEQVRAMNIEELAIKSAQIVAGPITEGSVTEGSITKGVIT